MRRGMAVPTAAPGARTAAPTLGATHPFRGNRGIRMILSMKNWKSFRQIAGLDIVFLAIGVAKIPAVEFSALVFSKTLLFRHASITNGIAAIKALGNQNHFRVDATEDSSWFSRANL